MASIKSFTDLEQSRKLAYILPHESADMCHIATADDDKGDYLYTAEYKSEIILREDDTDYINCWSLAALLNVLPKINGLKSILDLEENSIQYTGIDLYVVADNPIDACYEMIIKLHKTN